MSEYGTDPGWLAYQQQMNDNNMRTLVLLHRIYGAIQLVLSCCAMLWISFVFGIIGFAASSDPGSKPPPQVAGFIIGVWATIILFVLLVASLNFLCANWIKERRNWTGVMVLSVINCLHIPHGLALGVFTMITINKPEVKDSFT